jgi:hypothetical protein
MYMFRRAFIAFVRHGHDVSTISEDGSLTLEEDRRERQRMSEIRAERAAAKVAKP